jgi:quercetin dioxygenase-like cupin family protein
MSEQGYSVIRAAELGAKAVEELPSVFATVLGESVEPSSVLTFEFSIPAGTVMEPHRHTGIVGAFITGGRAAFGFGGGFSDRFELEPGDLVVIGANEPHAEEAFDGEPVTMVVGYLEPFSTEADKEEG